MLLLQVVKLLMLSYVRDVTVAVVTVVTKVNEVPSAVSRTGAEIAVLPVLVPVKNSFVHPLFTVWTDAVLCTLLPLKRGVYFVDAA